MSDLTFAIALSLFLANPARANDEFGNKGIVKIETKMKTDLHDLFLQADGKIIIVAQQDDLGVWIRHNQNGSIDNTFGKDGKLLMADVGFELTPDKENFMSIPAQGIDGTYYAATIRNGAIAVKHITADGRRVLWASPANAPVLPAELRNCDDGYPPLAMTETSDKGLALLGVCMHKDDGTHFVQKYMATGVLDKTFGLEGTKIIGSIERPKPEFAARVRQAPNLKELVGGSLVAAVPVMYYADLLDRSDLFIAKLTAKGVFDESFGSEGKTTFRGKDPSGKSIHMLRQVNIEDNGTIQVLYEGLSHRRKPVTEEVAHLLSNGDLDVSYGEGGIKILGVTHPDKFDGFDSTLLPNDGLIMVGWCRIPREGENLPPDPAAWETFHLGIMAFQKLAQPYERQCIDPGSVPDTKYHRQSVAVKALPDGRAIALSFDIHFDRKEETKAYMNYALLRINKDGTVR